MIGCARRSLPAPGRSRPALDCDYAAPLTPIEESLTALWAEVLELDAVGIHDSFFELGGDSLRGTRAITRLRDDLGIELPLRSLFEQPTAAGLAVVIAQLLAGGAEAEELQRMLEELAIRQSLANLRSFPFVADRESSGRLTLLGCHFSISDGELWLLDEAEDSFRPV